MAPLSIGAAALLLTASASALAAQDLQQPCPFTSDSVVSPALGTAVHGYADAGSAPGFESCEFGDFTIYHQSGPDLAVDVGVGGLAQNLVVALPPDVAAQIAALGAGRTLDLPKYHIATLSGLGDAALWVKDSSFGVDALLVRRGSEIFVFQVLDRPDAQALSTAVARAVIASAPAADVPVAPSGDRPAVVADCGLDAANAVADRLLRADVTEINVIGGCHYVAISTTLDGQGIANAATGRQICDAATEVAYTGSDILGITVTDGAGHERASGANGQPCSGFP